VNDIEISIAFEKEKVKEKRIKVEELKRRSLPPETQSSLSVRNTLL
jgi:hypothetical protein